MITHAPLVLLTALGAGAGQAGDIQIERVFGPEVPGRYKHPASFTQLANEDLYLVYYGGSGEYGTDTAVYGSRRRRGNTRWSPPRIIADTPGRSEGNAVVWQAPGQSGRFDHQWPIRP